MTPIADQYDALRAGLAKREAERLAALNTPAEAFGHPCATQAELIAEQKPATGGVIPPEFSRKLGKSFLVGERGSEMILRRETTLPDATHVVRKIVNLDNGDALTREEITACIWGDVHLADFERADKIDQMRKALGYPQGPVAADRIGYGCLNDDIVEVTDSDNTSGHREFARVRDLAADGVITIETVINGVRAMEAAERVNRFGEGMHHVSASGEAYGSQPKAPSIPVRLDVGDVCKHELNTWIGRLVVFCDGVEVSECAAYDIEAGWYEIYDWTKAGCVRVEVLPRKRLHGVVSVGLKPK